MTSEPAVTEATATDTTPTIPCRAIPLTVLTPMKPWGMLTTRAAFLYAKIKRGKKTNTRLDKLSFIHFARWAFLKRIAYNGDPQRRERLHYRYLLFEVSYNGSFGGYIDEFSYILPQYMRLIWGGSYGFPGPVPVEDFKRYIRKNELPVLHYYAAYPESSATMVLSAQRLEPRFAAFQAETADLRPPAFAAAYRRFVRANQRDL